MALQPSQWHRAQTRSSTAAASCSPCPSAAGRPCCLTDRVYDTRRHDVSFDTMLGSAARQAVFGFAPPVSNTSWSQGPQVTQGTGSFAYKNPGV